MISVAQSLHIAHLCIFLLSELFILDTSFSVLFFNILIKYFFCIIYYAIILMTLSVRYQNIERLKLKFEILLYHRQNLKPVVSLNSRKPHSKQSKLPATSNFFVGKNLKRSRYTTLRCNGSSIIKNQSTVHYPRTLFLRKKIPKANSSLEPTNPEKST